MAVECNNPNRDHNYLLYYIITSSFMKQNNTDTANPCP